MKLKFCHIFSNFIFTLSLLSSFSNEDFVSVVDVAVPVFAVFVTDGVTVVVVVDDDVVALIVIFVAAVVTVGVVVVIIAVAHVVVA